MKTQSLTMYRAAKSATLAFLGILVLGALAIAVALRLSLPELDGIIKLSGLNAPVAIDFDGHGIPRIAAHGREDAYLALGFVTARDRLFQMDLARRSAAGRLAEILGDNALESDRWNRIMGFEQVAQAIGKRLPPDQRATLEAFSQGVNEAIADITVLPLEFLALAYRPEPWRPIDSLLIVLGMYTMLTWTGDQERMASVMEAALPPGVVELFTPETNCYEEHPGSQDAASCYQDSPPLTDLYVPPTEAVAFDVERTAIPRGKRGSNAWSVGPANTRGKRAILANDMHLSLSVPNIWYRAQLRYGEAELTGLTVPGIPLVVVGSTGRVAWGFASIEGDFVDLVVIERTGKDSSRYRTPAGTKPFRERVETINVRGKGDVSLRVRETIWGPVMRETLLGNPVAVRWSALDPEATNLDLMSMDRVTGLQETLSLLNRAGGPAMSAVVADAQGNIGWTYMGRVPKRVGHSGLFSRSWKEGNNGWQGYVEPEALPRIVNPSSGVIISANQRMLPRTYFYRMGHDFSGGYRARRIAERLQEVQPISERDMLQLQLDTQADFYRYYHRLALQALQRSSDNEFRVGLRRHLEAWHGRADVDSIGFSLLQEFRFTLLHAVVTPLFAACREIDPSFSYSWSNSDVPLQRLLRSRSHEILPAAQRGKGWDAFLVEALEKSALNLLRRYDVDTLDRLHWGRVNRAHITHPLSQAIPWLTRLLDMMPEPLAGCPQCVRLADGDVGASARMVVSPGHEVAGILHMPGGQSGHPLSPFYRDQQAFWVQGSASPFLADSVRHRLQLVPATTGDQRPSPLTPAR